MKSKTKKLKILPGLQKWTKKTASALLSAGMALSVFTSPSTVMADGLTGSTTETSNDESYNSDINPKFTIQHYLNFPSLEIYTKEEAVLPTGVDSNPIPKSSGITGLDVYNTAIEYQGEGAKDPLTLENDGTKTPRYQIGIANKDDVKPFPDDSLNKDAVFSKGEVITRNKLEELFMDETVNYLERPQIQYMNRLFNSTTGDNAYNANYTLSAVWVLKPGKSADSVQPDDFFIFPVPYLIQKGTIPTTEGGTLRHNPSRIRFTNNPKTIADIAEKTKKQVDSTSVEAPDDSKSIAAKTKSLIYMIDGQQYEDYEWYILIQEDSVIRFVFDPTNQDDYINANGVNFYD